MLEEIEGDEASVSESLTKTQCLATVLDNSKHLHKA